MKLKHIEKLIRKLFKSYKYIEFFISKLIPKDKNIWVFGTYNNGFSDNAKYLYLYIRDNYPQIKAVWISRSKSESDFLNKKGVNAIYKFSKEGKYFLKKAYYHFVNTNLIDTDFWSSGGAKYVNLWHGIPLKKIEFDIEKGTNSWKYQSSTKLTAIIKKISFPALYRKPDYLLCSSERLSGIMKRSFRTDDQSLIAFDYPRNCVFSMKHNELRNLVHRFETENELTLFDSIEKHAKTYLYLPTFRDGKNDFLISSHINFEVLNNFLKKSNNLLIVKFHPNIKLDRSNFSHIKFMKSSVDIYPFLPKCSCLITDYSSVYFDFLIAEKEIIFYCYDKNEYLQSLRGINFDYDQVTPGQKCYTFNNLLNAFASENDTFKDQRLKLKQEIWNIKSDNELSDLVYFFIEESK